ARIPTLLYRCGDVEIEDRSVGRRVEDGGVIQRELRIESPAPQQLWLRLLSGDVELGEDGVLQSGRLRISALGHTTLLRPASGDEGAQEALLMLNLPQGLSTWKLSYDILP
ncbi:MAG: hypothetical protein AAGG01_00255, partial [Planctomycetota bacterium]